MSDAVVKETKAQRSERLKLEKNPWDALDEVRTVCARGARSVLPEWAELYFKWWGVYTQGDGAGVTGGKGGEGHGERVLHDAHRASEWAADGEPVARRSRTCAEVCARTLRTLRRGRIFSCTG